MSDTDTTAAFEAQRPRLIGLATRMLGDAAEAQDVVQQAWLRMDRTTTRDEAVIDNLPAWLTTVTTRLCLDRLRARTPVPVEDVELGADGDEAAGDPADDVALADTVGLALHVVLDRLTPRERVAFVLHDSFGFEFGIIAAVLDTSSQSARKLASRARAKVAQPASEDRLADWEVSTLVSRVEEMEAGEEATGSRIGSALRLINEVNPPFEALLIYAWRRHLAAAVGRIEAMGAKLQASVDQLRADHTALKASVEKTEADPPRSLATGGGKYTAAAF